MQPRALIACAVVLTLGTPRAWAREVAISTEAARDDYALFAHGETHAQLFQRALLPGPSGALVASETLAPIYQYWVLAGRDIDAAGQRDSLDIDVSLWGRAGLFESDYEHRLDGDIQSASLRYRVGPIALRLGRQHVAGGAARYARFDGAEFELTLGRQISARAYAGFGVMPRWNERPGYVYLGAASDAGLRDLARTPQASRAAQWLTGGRLAWMHPRGGIGASWHEQHTTGGVDHRNLGLDARGSVGPFHAGADGILELQTNRIADARLFVDYTPISNIDLSFEYLHTEPALLLSRQSVLSVFSQEGYDETGGYARFRVGHAALVESGGFVQWFSSGLPGRRAELTASTWLEPQRVTLLRATYSRVITPDNGYWALRASLLRRVGAFVTSTLDGYLYLYDDAVQGYRSAAVYSGTITYRPAPQFSALWGVSLARTPLAGLDAQTQLRLSYDFDLVSRGGRR